MGTALARFTDLEALEARIPAIQRVEVLSEGPFGEGTRWRETRRMFGHDSTEEMWVTACNLPHGCDLEADSHGSRYLTAFRFEPASERAAPAGNDWTKAPAPSKRWAQGAGLPQGRRYGIESHQALHAPPAVRSSGYTTTDRRR